MKVERRRVSRFAACVLALFAGCATSLVKAQSIVVIDVPDATATIPVSINNRGDVAGYYCSDACLPNIGQALGFVRAADGTITTFDGVPTSINDAGTVAGYLYAAGPSPGSGYHMHSFVREPNGRVTTFELPQPDPWDPGRVHAAAINNGGDVAGFIVPCQLCDTWFGFVRDRRGSLTTFVMPNGLVPTSINARGDVAGHTGSYYFAEEGFVRDRKGNITNFAVDGARGPGPRAYSLGINNRGDVTGYYRATGSDETRGFLREFDGTITTFDGIPTSISDAGVVAGYGYQGHGFVRDQSGDVTTFDIPNADSFQVAAINNRGDVVGSFGAHGFIRTAH